jgi:hypothetical protein
LPLALVTGTRRHLGPAAATLGRAGFDVMTWTVESSDAPADGPFDCYVQLPCAVSDLAATPPLTPRRPNSRAVDDLVCRIDTLAAVADRLHPNASILLAVEGANPTAGAQSGVLAPDLLVAGAQPGRLAPDLLAAVALALLEDLGRPAARLAVVSVAGLCRQGPAAAGAADQAPFDRLLGADQWEMPTPPLVSAP